MKVAIIGSGPAGISCALWLNSLEITPTIISPIENSGGTLLHVYNSIRDYPPNVYEDGQTLALALGRSVPDAWRFDAWVTEISLGSQPVVSTTQEQIQCDVVVLATGTHHRMLQIPGEEECIAKGAVSHSATKDGTRFAGEEVAVVGGGDAAFENALILADLGCRVTIFSRSPPRARQAFQQSVEQNANIRSEKIGVVPVALAPAKSGCELTRSDGSSKSYAGLFVRIGVEPNLPRVSQMPATRGGFVVVDTHQKTDLDRLYAIGDITDTALRSVATAIGDGAKAAKAIRREFYNV